MKTLNIDRLVTQVTHRIVILKARDTSRASNDNILNDIDTSMNELLQSTRLEE
jgi:hypothetical protein